MISSDNSKNYQIMQIEPEIKHIQNEETTKIFDENNESCEICKLKYSFKLFCEFCVRDNFKIIFQKCSSRSDDNLAKSICDNLAYMAPEVIFGKQRTPESEIYSLGMLLLEFLSGKRPYYGYEHNRDLAVKILSGMRPKILQEIPLEYYELIKQCLDAIPSKRPILKTIFETLKIDEKYKKILEKKTNNNLQTSNTMSVNQFKDLPEPRNAAEGEDCILFFFP
jgi:serine/threonine protein kinase